MSAISILAEVDRTPLENGMELRLVSAWELLAIRQEALKLSRSEADRGLCVNACLMAYALESEGVALFEDGEAVLKGLSVEEIANLAKLWREFNEKVNPSPCLPQEELDSLKKN